MTNIPEVTMIANTPADSIAVDYEMLSRAQRSNERVFRSGVSGLMVGTGIDLGSFIAHYYNNYLDKICAYYPNLFQKVEDGGFIFGTTLLAVGATVSLIALRRRRNFEDREDLIRQRADNLLDSDKGVLFDYLRRRRLLSLS